ncbi:unnamed protein product, partial [Polarella glacialis]
QSVALVAQAPGTMSQAHTMSTGTMSEGTMSEGTMSEGTMSFGGASRRLSAGQARDAEPARQLHIEALKSELREARLEEELQLLHQLLARERAQRQAAERQLERGRLGAEDLRSRCWPELAELAEFRTAAAAGGSLLQATAAAESAALVSPQMRPQISADWHSGLQQRRHSDCSSDGIQVSPQNIGLQQRRHSAPLPIGALVSPQISASTPRGSPGSFCRERKHPKSKASSESLASNLSRAESLVQEMFGCESVSPSCTPQARRELASSSLLLPICF